MKNKILSVLSILFPVSVFTNLISELKPYFCKHSMRYWDMKWYVEDESSHFYEKFNGKVWPDSFCQCQKCGVKYRKIYLPKKWGEWKRSDFTTSKTKTIEVEIFEFGKESKSQKRERLLNKLGIK